MSNPFSPVVLSVIASSPKAVYGGAIIDMVTEAIDNLIATGTLRIHRKDLDECACNQRLFTAASAKPSSPVLGDNTPVGDLENCFNTEQLTLIAKLLAAPHAVPATELTSREYEVAYMLREYIKVGNSGYYTKPEHRDFLKREVTLLDNPAVFTIRQAQLLRFLLDSPHAITASFFGMDDTAVLASLTPKWVTKGHNGYFTNPANRAILKAQLDATAADDFFSYAEAALLRRMLESPHAIPEDNMTEEEYDTAQNLTDQGFVVYGRTGFYTVRDEYAFICEQLGIDPNAE